MRIVIYYKFKLTNMYKKKLFRSIPRAAGILAFLFSSTVLVTFRMTDNQFEQRLYGKFSRDVNVNSNNALVLHQLQSLLRKYQYKSNVDVSKLQDVHMLLYNTILDNNDTHYTINSNKLLHYSKHYKDSISTKLHKYLLNEPNITEREFKPYLKPSDKMILYETLDTLYQICRTLEFTCLMYSGTLLGSWRHHDIIPWDGDADIMANSTEKDELYSALSMLSTYEVYNSGTRFKFYSKKGTQTSQYPWKWPYVDIWFFRENSTHIWDEIPSRAFLRDYVYPKSIIFPVHLRPLGTIVFPAPFDSFKALSITYKSTDCETYFYNHQLEKTQREMFRVLPCYQLRNQIAFVFRIKHENQGLTELLIKGSDVLNVQNVDEPQYAVSNPFNLTLLSN